MNIEVRKYVDDDLDAVNEILLECFSCTKNNFNDNCFTEIVVTTDNIVRGYLLLTKVLNPIKNKYYYLIDYVCVTSKYRGFGLSDELMKFAEELAREDNAIYLQLSCSRFRVGAHKLYERCGFIKRQSDIFRKVIE